jgi:hypothetical protein
MYSKPAPSNATDADHDITFPAGSYLLTNGTSYKIFNLATAMTKQIDATWSAGTDAGGRASGVSLSSDTMYYSHAIGKANGTIDFQFDTSATADNRDSAYSWYGIVRGNFVVFTDSSSNISGFTVVRDRVLWSSPVLDVNDSSLTSGVAETGTATAPPSAIIFGYAVAYGNGTTQLLITITDEAGERDINKLFINDNQAGTLENVRSGEYCEIFLDASRQFDYKLTITSGSASSLTWRTHGYFLTA